MSFDPQGFIAVADHLRSSAGQDGCPSDAALRVAIGRYYYAALLCSRDFLELSESGPTDRADTTHRWVIGKFRESGEGNAQRLHAELDRMRRTRNLADYGDDLADLPGAAKKMQEGCTRAMAWLKALRRRHEQARR